MSGGLRYSLIQIWRTHEVVASPYILVRCYASCYVHRWTETPVYAAPHVMIHLPSSLQRKCCWDCKNNIGHHREWLLMVLLWLCNRNTISHNELYNANASAHQSLVWSEIYPRFDFLQRSYESDLREPYHRTDRCFVHWDDGCHSSERQRVSGECSSTGGGFCDEVIPIIYSNKATL